MDSLAYYKGMLEPGEFARITELNTLVELLDNGLSKYADHHAVQWDGESRTYAQLGEDTALMCGYLQTLSLRSGAHVAMLMRNHYDFVKTFLAITTMGYVAVLIPVTIQGEQLKPLLSKFDADCLIYDAVFCDMMKSDLPVHAVCCDDCTGGMPRDAVTGICRDTPAAILFSTGTTGKPKGALLSHGALMRGALNGIYGWRKTFEMRYLLLIPLTHVFGLIRNMLTSMYTGSSLYICTNMQNLFHDLKAAKPTVMVLVPQLAEMLYRYALANGVQSLGGALQYIICGGAAVPPRLILNMHRLSIAVLPGYGLTETANLVSGNGEFLKYPDSVGRAYPQEALKIVDGELWVKGDHLMLRYYNDPGETAKVFSEGWFKTGDLARMDDEGRLYIIGRIKNIIVTDNGENVSPEELEALIGELPLVQDCLVKTAANPFGGKILEVEILPNIEACKKMRISDLSGALREHIDAVNKSLPAFKQIQKITVRDTDFPRHSNMKIIRP